MNKYVVIVIGIIVVIISALTILNTPSDTTILLPSPYAEDSASAVNVIADGLEFPTGIAVLPDKKIVITEQTGKAVILNSNGSQLNNYQVMDNYFDEARMLDVAHAYQQVTDWHTKMPEGLA